MYKVIKSKTQFVKAYQLGSDNPVIKSLMDEGKITVIGNGRYEIYSQEAIKGGVGGEHAQTGDWIKVDNSGNPYPNKKEFFETNHSHVEGDVFKQLPKPVQAWDVNLEICPEIEFLVKKQGLIINEGSFDQRYTATLWGTKEVATKDAVIIFYSISYDKSRNIIDCDWNFVERDEFERTYSIIN